jgi:hypothetical protein
VFDALSEKDAMALLTSPLKADGAPDSPTTVARGENERAAGSAAKSAAVTPVLPRRAPLSPRSPNTTAVTPITPAVDGSFSVADLSFNSQAAGSTPGAALSVRRKRDDAAAKTPLAAAPDAAAPAAVSRSSPTLSSSPTAFHARVGAESAFDEGTRTGGAFSPTVTNAVAAAAIVNAAAACTPGNKLTHPTPANTPADAVLAPASPEREDVVEEVRSWFASVHSKLDVALAAVSPGHSLRKTLHGTVATPPPPPGASKHAAAAPSTTPATAPKPPPPGALLYSKESPATMMAPDGAIARLLAGTPSPPAALTRALLAMAERSDAEEEEAARATPTPAAKKTDPEKTPPVSAARTETPPLQKTPPFSSTSPSPAGWGPPLFSPESAAGTPGRPGFTAAECLALEPHALRVFAMVACAALMSGYTVAICVFAASCACSLTIAVATGLARVLLPGAFAAAPEPVRVVMHGAHLVYPPFLADLVFRAEAFLSAVFRGAQHPAADAAHHAAAAQAPAGPYLTLEGLAVLAFVLATAALGAGLAALAAAPEGAVFARAMEAAEAVEAAAVATRERARAALAAARAKRAKMKPVRETLALEGMLRHALRLAAMPW